MFAHLSNGILVHSEDVAGSSPGLSQYTHVDSLKVKFEFITMSPESMFVPIMILNTHTHTEVVTSAPMHTHFLFSTLLLSRLSLTR